MTSFFRPISARRVTRVVTNHPYLVIIAVLIVTACLAYRLPQLSFRTSIYDMVIEDLPESGRYEEFKKTFGSDEIIQVVARGGNFFDPKTFRELANLADRMEKIEGVRQVISLSGIKKAMDVTDKWSLDEYRTAIAPVSLLWKNVISENEKATTLTLVLKTDADRDSVIRAVEDVIADASKGITLYQIGMPLVSQALASFSERDFLRLPPFTFLIIIIILFVLFRNLPCVILPVACILLVLIWTFGLMAWIGIGLSMLTMVVPILIIAVGTAYCLHICSEYLSNARNADSPREATLSTFAAISLPTCLAVFTTVIGLGSLLVNRIVAIQEFALFSCFGMLCLLAIMLTLLPAGLSLFPLPKREMPGFPSLNGFFDKVLGRIVKIDLYYQKIALLILGLVVAVSLIGILRIKVETNPMQFFKESTPLNRRFHDACRDLSGSFPVHVVMKSENADYFEDPRHLESLDKLQRFFETLPNVDKTISFADYLKLVNYAVNKYEPDKYALPREGFEVSMLVNNFKTMLGRDMLARFMNQDFSEANIVLLTHLSSSRDFIETRKRILDYVRNNFSKDLSWEVTGLGIVISASNDVLTNGQVKSLSLTLILVFGIMFLLFVSLKVGLVALIPNIFPIVVNFGVMGWAGINLDMGTSLIACIAIGLAVDDTIHYLVRYSREIRKDLNRNRALNETLKSVGRPIIFTSLIIGIGFSVLMLSHFQPTSTFGLMMVITILAALVGDLILLPTLMLHVELVTAWDLLKLMKPLSKMSADNVHELNQPLNAIKMGSDFLKMMLEQKRQIPEEQLSEVVREIGDQVDRASNIVRLLGDFDRPGDFIKEKVVINEPVREVFSIIGRHLELENIKLDADLAENLPPIEAHKNRLEQVIFNLLANARDAINRKRRVANEAGNHTISVKSFMEGRRVAVTVSDTGVGMSKAVMDRIFEPFYTTKEMGKGAGLGLSITYSIVKDYRGDITVHSEKGRGSTFTVTFPVSRN